MRQKPADDRFTDALGVELGHRWTAIEAVGLYVPGGTAAYPSSVLMNAVPAKVAGVPRIVMVVPAPGRQAQSAGAGGGEAWRRATRSTGSAARRRWPRSPMARQTIAPVAKIVGPGNAYVAAAKRLVFGKVGIDMIAGPSEVLVLADGNANPDWIAADLLAQAEHDAAAQSILITDDAGLADAVETGGGRAAEDAAARGGRRRVVEASSARSFWCAISTRRCRWSTRIAPEHLELIADDAERLAGKIRNAGAIFIGGVYAGSDRRLCRRLQPRAADRALGALLLGPRRARFHEAHLDPEMRARPAGGARARRRSRLARRRGLQAHARSVAIRLNKR